MFLKKKLLHPRCNTEIPNLPVNAAASTQCETLSEICVLKWMITKLVCDCTVWKRKKLMEDSNLIVENCVAF
jgi:hypothetical protein